MRITELRNARIGIVFSGGGVRGMAHIGLIKALEERGIEVQFVSGSSVGALIGALYANGNSVQQMLALFKETPLFRYNFITIQKPGLVDTDRYYEIFKQYLTVDSFENLEKELFVVATNLQKGEYEVFCQGELIRPLLASAALPPVFSPVEIDNCLYADGGIMNNFPVEPLKDRCDFIIGSNVSIIQQITRYDIRTSLQLANRTTALMIYAINKEKMKLCDLFFEPQELEHIGVLDKKGLEKAYFIGYQHATKVLKAVLE